MTLTLLLADDHRLVRQGVGAILGTLPGLQVVGEAGDGPEAVRLAERLRPDVAVLDLRMPGLNGIEVTRELARCCPRTRVVILSMYADPGYAAEALRAGALAYVLKEAGIDDLARGIRAAAAGEEYLSPALPRDVVLTRLSRGDGADPYQALTLREREVLHLTAEGCSSGEVARRLHISPRTVETHRASLMRKLGVRNQKELIRYAVQHREPGGE